MVIILSFDKMKRSKLNHPNSSVATINNGVITAVGKGQAIITVTSEDGNYTATCTVTVLKRVTGISASPTSAILPLGTEQDINITVTPNDASDTSYTTEYSTTGIVQISTEVLLQFVML